MNIAEVLLPTIYSFCGFTLLYPLVLMSKLNYQLKGMRCASEAHVGQLPLKVSQATLMGSTAQQTGMISR